jgi:hypothetical protein
MPALLYGIGAFALFAGLVMIGFGVPINEFSFGNTLISAGTTAVVGGLILFGLGIVAGQLRRVAEALVAGAPVRQAEPGEAFENADTSLAPPLQGRVAPLRPKPEPSPAEPGTVSPAPFSLPPISMAPDTLAPALRNPDMESAIEDEASLSPHHGLTPAAQSGGDLGGIARPSAPPAGGAGSGMPAKNREAGWRSPAPVTPAATPPPVRTFPNANFDAMWPTEDKLPKAPAAEPTVPLREPSVPPPKRAEPEKPRAAAILKSGVVDGMGYTLYVDGSIEAELPQGTLRFASINELRSHIAKNS